VVLHGIMSQLKARAQIQVYELASTDDHSLSVTTRHSADVVPDEIQ
jgi:hypothetical protein